MNAFRLYVTDSGGSTIDLNNNRTVPRLSNASKQYAHGEVGISFSGHTISAASSLMLNDTPRGSGQAGHESGSSGSIDIEALLDNPDHVWTDEELVALFEWLNTLVNQSDEPGDEPGDDPGDDPGDEPGDESAADGT